MLNLSIAEFKAAPFKHIVVTLFFFLGVMTGLFAGITIMAYFWFLSKPVSTRTNILHFEPFMNAQHPRLLRAMQFSMHFSGHHRTMVLSLLGFLLWILITLTSFGFHELFLGTPICWYFCQPILLLMMIVDAYDVELKIASKALWHLVSHKPIIPFSLMAISFCSFSGIWISYIPLGGVERYFSFLILVTLPIMLRTSLMLFRQFASVLNDAIQKAYD